MSTTPTIALVDDDGDDRSLVHSLLQAIHPQLRINHCIHGQQLLDLLNSSSDAFGEPSSSLPQLVLLDVNMPIKNGWETLAELKKHQDWKVIPVVMFSTSSTRKDIELCYQLGGNAYVCKPMDYPTLVSNIEAIYNFWLVAAK